MIEEQFDGELNQLRSLAQKVYYMYKQGIEIDKWKESDLYDEILTASAEWYDEFFVDKSKDEQIKSLKAELSSLKVALKEIAPDEGNISTGQDILEEPTDNSGIGSGRDDGSIGTTSGRDPSTINTLGK